jgi:hypothetical protein
MLGWTKTFGTSLTSIRTPEMLLGVLSIFLIYLVGTAAYDARVGVVAAGLLSLHGFHIFWSQSARMWVPGACLGLLSTWLLLQMTRAPEPRPRLELAYVLTSIAGTMTVTFYWALMSVQILWTALGQRRTSGQAPRAAVVQTFAFILPAPMLAHGVMLARDGVAPGPSLEFLRDYFAFGFLFVPGQSSDQFYDIPAWVSLSILACSVLLQVLGLRIGAHEQFSEQRPMAARRPLIICAAASSLTMLGIAATARARNQLLVALSVLPFVALFIPPMARKMTGVSSRVRTILQKRSRAHPARLGLIANLAYLPTLVIFAASYKFALTAPRAFALFVPYLLIVTAAGAVALSSRRPPAAVTAVALVATFSASAVMLHFVPISLRDYQGLSRALNASLQPGDLILTRNRDWSHTPIFYYLDHDRLVAGHYDEALRGAPRARAWVLVFDGNTPSDTLLEALSDYQIAGRVNASRAEAILYVPRL